MNRTDAIRKIGHLEDEHREQTGEGGQNCKGCEICDEIKKLSPYVAHSPRVAEILAKGEYMTKQEIIHLADRHVPAEDIVKALNMSLDNFNTMWLEWTGSKLRKKHDQTTGAAIMELTKATYINYKNQGLRDKEIMKLIKWSSNSLNTWKKKTFTTNEIYELNIPKGKQGKTTKTEIKTVKTKSEQNESGFNQKLEEQNQVIVSLQKKINILESETVDEKKYRDLKIDFEETLHEKADLVQEHIGLKNENHRLRELLEEKTREAEKYKTSFEDAKRVLIPLKTLSLEYLSS